MMHVSGTNECPLGKHMEKYWSRLTERERGMRMDEEALYSLTLESVAVDHALQMKGGLVVDAFCGAGGNAIGLARTGKRVITFDTNQDRLEMARYNARLFEVEDLIEFRQGDCLQQTDLKADAIFLDPPWGGPGYSSKGLFKLEHFLPSGKPTLDWALTVADTIGFKLPHTFDLNELKQFKVPFTVKADVLNDELLGYCAYFSNALQDREHWTDADAAEG